ncbi:MAG TPA: hypothetical protein VLX31_19865 [Streptosporangiaceae bacterium]|nr:hypothetical protein [Streptosporangiaceae bacterium]
MTEQDYPPRQTGHPGRSGWPRVPHDSRRSGWQVLDAFEDRPVPSGAPPWAVPGGVEPVRAGRRPTPLPGDELGDGPRADQGPAAPPSRRGRLAGRTRAAAARRRRSKRRLVTWAGAAIGVILVVTAGILLSQSPAPKSRYVTTWQAGDIRTVPDACKVVGAATLRGYLAGTPIRIQPYSSASQSQCTYQVDAKPTFRMLNIVVQAFPPNLTVAAGNGSATATATYTYSQQRQILAHPPKNTPQPPAAIGALGGFGNEAVTAVQVFHVKTWLLDRVTVLARYHNVLVTVYVSGQNGDGFGPVTIASLRASTLAAARAVLAQVEHEPKVG